MSDFDFTPENVNGVIRQHIGQGEARIAELHPINSKELIEKMRFAINALEQLQHELHLCHCPDEVYEKESEREP